MGKMSENNFVERFCHKYFQKHPKKGKDEILKELTHLYLNGRKLEEIGELSCDQLKVLYLHNNSIKKITNLNQMCHLTHLYLQWNRIRKIENLDALKNLKKLYLSYNEIQRLECVENLHQLEELHLEYQNLASSQYSEFTFDVDSIIGISTSLRLLNISGLNLKNLNALKSLPHLTEIIAANNQFEDSHDIVSSIAQLQRLKLATFSNCPAHKNDIYYRNKIILASNTLEFLDNKQINDVTRLFLKNFDKIKSEQKQKRSVTDVDGPCVDESITTNNTVDIDLRDNNQSIVRSDPIALDVTNIISQAIVENGQCRQPWLIFGGCTFLTEYIAASPKPILDKNDQVTK